MPKYASFVQMNYLSHTSCINVFDCEQIDLSLVTPMRDCDTSTIIRANPAIVL